MSFEIRIDNRIYDKGPNTGMAEVTPDIYAVVFNPRSSGWEEEGEAGWCEVRLSDERIENNKGELVEDVKGLSLKPFLYPGYEAPPGSPIRVEIPDLLEAYAQLERLETCGIRIQVTNPSDAGPMGAEVEEEEPPGVESPEDPQEAWQEAAARGLKPKSAGEQALETQREARPTYDANPVGSQHGSSGTRSDG